MIILILDCIRYAQQLGCLLSSSVSTHVYHYSTLLSIPINLSSNFIIMAMTIYQNFTNWQLSLPYEEIIGGLHMEAKDAIRICEYLSSLSFLSMPCCDVLCCTALNSILF